LEAKQHGLLFDGSEEEPEEGVEVNKHKIIQVSDAESTRKMYKDEGVDFDMILQAQQANTRLQTYEHELLDSDGSDEEAVAEGLLHFSNSDSEDKLALQCPSAMEEALAHDARGEIDDPDEGIEESIEEKVATKSPKAKLPKGLLQWDSSDEEDEETFQLCACGFMSSKEEAISDQLNDGIEGEGSESIIGEQEGDASGLTESDADQH